MDRRRELKQEYKQTLRPMGVYQILNRANGRRLVGSSMDLPGILNRQRFQLRVGRHPNAALDRDWREYGEENFTFEVLEELEPSQESGHDHTADLRVLEEIWLEKLQPYGDRGYNGKAPPAR